MRKLASVQKIESLRPIPDADQIEVARVQGWDVVVKRGEFKPGDLCVYCEIDSYLPIKPEFEFLRKSSYKRMGEDEGFRLKTVRLRKQVSQGLILPYDLVPDAELGEDVSERLGIVKYDPPIPAELDGVVKGYRPRFVPMTDEERVQNLVQDYDKYLETPLWVWTEKLDGTSASFFHHQGQFGVCGRNVEYLESDNSFWKVARELELEQKLAGRDLVLQGELIGPGIQGRNRYGLKKPEARFFNAIDIGTRKKLGLDPFLALMRELELETVPILERARALPRTPDEILALAEGRSALADTPREGLVLRNPEYTMSFKAVSNAFLLKKKEQI